MVPGVQKSHCYKLYDNTLHKSVIINLKIHLYSIVYLGTEQSLYLTVYPVSSASAVGIATDLMTFN